MTDVTPGALGPGDRAPDFELPAADADGTVTLGAYRRRGPILLTMLRGLYCPFCRRHISLLRSACETLRASGIGLLGIVIASPERARTYFRHFPPCFPMAAAPDRAIHRAYGLPEVARSPELRGEVEDRAAEAVRELGLQASPGEATTTFRTAGGFEMTTEDTAEWQRPLQSVGAFLIGQDGLIRWARIDASIPALPRTEELLGLL